MTQQSTEENGPMRSRRLGSTQLKVPAIGFGCMVLPGFYHPGSETEAIATLHRAAELARSISDASREHPGSQRLCSRKKDQIVSLAQSGQIWPPSSIT